MSDYITFEIQEEIIKKLPVKSVIRVRSVSKAWKALIDSPQFIAAYSLRQTHTHHLLIRYKDMPKIREQYVSFVDDDTFPQQKFAPTVPLSIKQLCYNLQVVGSSCGLLCLYGCYPHPDNPHNPEYEKEGAVIWNPSIRKSVAIELPDVNDPCGPVLGFGVCPATSDPNLVNFTWWGTMTMSKKNLAQVSVYTLSSGEWRTLSCNLPSQSIHLTGDQVVIDRFIYWLALIAINGGFQTSYTIISFDMITDKFSEVCLPDSLTHAIDKVNVSKVWESLAMLEYSMDTDKRICVIWMMENGPNGVPKSFTKLFTIKTAYASMTILGFKKSGEPIMETMDFESYDTPSALVVYEPYSEHINDLGISFSSGSFLSGSFFVNSYVETLLLLGQ